MGPSFDYDDYQDLRITSGLPVLRPKSMPSAEITPCQLTFWYLSDLNAQLVPNCGSVHYRWPRGPIGPFAGQNHKNGYVCFKVIDRYNRRAGQIGSPAFRGITRNKKHDMWMPVPGTIV
jgi:hypothetical protein